MTFDERPPTLGNAAVEHQVGALRRFKLGVGTVLAGQQIGGGGDLRSKLERSSTPPNAEFGDQTGRLDCGPVNVEFGSHGRIPK